MKRFRYALDPLCIAALLLYALNHWFWDLSALRGWFSDILLIPAAAPLFLWVERKLQLRSHDKPPNIRELSFLFVTWSVAAEILAPIFFPHCTGDPRDIAAYAVGAIVAALWWNVPAEKSPP